MDQNPGSQARPNLLRRWTVAGAALAATAAIAWHGRAHAQFGHRGGWHSADPATMGRKLDAMVAWALSDIDATPEQRDRISTIAKAAANDLAPMREAHKQARRDSVQLLAAPTIDRARLETLRLQQMQLGDTVSRRILQALADAAEVLNPEQRSRLAERWAQRRGLR